MATRYEDVRGPRFSIESADAGDTIVVPVRRQVFAIAFLIVWLCGWTFGGGDAVRALYHAERPGLLIWSIGWMLGEVFAIFALLWQISGREVIRVSPTGLHLSYSMIGLSRSKHFLADEIRNLTSSVPTQRDTESSTTIPIFGGYSSGSVKFDYGAKTIHLAGDLDESEGRMLASHLRELLPPSAAPRWGGLDRA